MLRGIKSTEWQYSYACMWMFGHGGPAFLMAFFIDYIFDWIYIEYIEQNTFILNSENKLHRVTKMKNNEQ